VNERRTTISLKGNSESGRSIAEHLPRSLDLNSKRETESLYYERFHKEDPVEKAPDATEE